MSFHAILLLGMLARLPGGPDATSLLRPREAMKPHTSSVTYLVFSPDGQTLVSCSNEIRFWDVVKEKELSRFAVPKGGVTGAAFSPDGKTLATVGSTGTLTLWDTTTYKAGQTFAIPGASANAVAFSRDGKRIGVAADKEVKLWDLGTNKEISSFTRGVSHYSPVFSPDLTLLAAGHYQDVDLWDTAKGKERKVLADHRGSVGRMAFAADGKTLAVAVQREVGGKPENEICFWDVEKGKQRQTFAGQADFVRAIALSSDGKWLAFENGTNALQEWEIRLVDVAANRVVGSTKPKNVSTECFTLSPDGKLLAAGIRDGTVQLWDVIPPAAKDK
jgi:WD40 repeat protein